MRNELPLPISVKSPADLAFKAEAERQYLIVNLMAGGRIAYESGDYARAVRDWESLLKIPNLPPGDLPRRVAAARRGQAPARRSGRGGGADGIADARPASGGRDLPRRARAAPGDHRGWNR